MAGPSLGSMPPEIIAMICLCVRSRSTLAQLARVDSTFFHAATRIMWQNTTFMVGNWQTQGPIFAPYHVLKGISVERRSMYSRYIQHLNFQLVAEEIEALRDDLELISEIPLSRLRGITICIGDSNLPNDLIDQMLAIVASHLSQDVEVLACELDEYYRKLNLDRQWDSNPTWLSKPNPLRLPINTNIKHLQLHNLMEASPAIETLRRCPVVKSFDFKPMRIWARIGAVVWGDLFDVLAQTKNLDHIRLSGINVDVPPPNSENLIKADHVVLHSVLASKVPSTLARFNLEQIHHLDIEFSEDTERVDALRPLATYSGVSVLRVLEVSIDDPEGAVYYDRRTRRQCSVVTLPADLLIGIARNHPKLQNLDFDGFNAYYNVREITDDVIREMAKAAPDLQAVYIAMVPRGHIRARKVCRSFRAHFPKMKTVRWHVLQESESDEEEELGDEESDETDEHESDYDEIDDFDLGWHGLDGFDSPDHEYDDVSDFIFAELLEPPSDESDDFY